MADYTNEILLEGLGHGVVSEKEAQVALAKLYLENNELQNKKFLNHDLKGAVSTLTIESVNMNELWEELKKTFCKIASQESVFNKVIDFILEAIKEIIPFGVFIKALVKVIIKFFLQEGIKLICPSN